MSKLHEQAQHLHPAGLPILTICGLWKMRWTREMSQSMHLHSDLRLWQHDMVRIADQILQIDYHTDVEVVVVDDLLLLAHALRAWLV